MPVKDVLLPLTGQPSTPALAAVEACVAAGAALGARITAFAVEEDVPVQPKVLIWPDLSDAAGPGDPPGVTDAQQLQSAFWNAASRFGVRADARIHRLQADMIAAMLEERARYSDLTLVPVKSHDSRSEWLVEALIFESGRPLLLCPEDYAGAVRPTLENVMIAWDGAAHAARAVADAMPILQAATSVRLITAMDDRTAAVLRSGAALVDHLREHRVFTAFEIVKIDGSSIGKVLGSWARAHDIDAIVMGAYHHSRLNEVVWGGVTKTVIGEPPCWVMMSH